MLHAGGDDVTPRTKIVIGCAAAAFAFWMYYAATAPVRLCTTAAGARF